MLQSICDWIYAQFPNVAREDALLICKQMATVAFEDYEHWKARSLWDLYDVSNSRFPRSESRMQ